MLTNPGLVAVLAYDGLCTFEFGIAVEIFGLPRPEFEFAWYTHRIVAVDPAPMHAAGGMQVIAEFGLSRSLMPIPSSFRAGVAAMSARRRCCWTPCAPRINAGRGCFPSVRGVRARGCGPSGRQACHHPLALYGRTRGTLSTH